MLRDHLVQTRAYHSTNGECVGTVMGFELIRLQLLGRSCEYSLQSCSQYLTSMWSFRHWALFSSQYTQHCYTHTHTHAHTHTRAHAHTHTHTHTHAHTPSELETSTSSCLWLTFCLQDTFFNSSYFWLRHWSTIFQPLFQNPPSTFRTVYCACTHLHIAKDLFATRLIWCRGLLIVSC